MTDKPMSRTPMNHKTEAARTFENYRYLLFSIAYRMVGSVMEAEDVVQDAYLRYTAADTAAVESPKAYLTTIVTRLALDHLKSARVQREQYVGPWLPEPLRTDQAPAQIVDRKETVSMAFLVLLEQLSPVERAVFLLREVFEYPYPEIAQIVEKSEANCRQLYSRAKKHLVADRPRFVTPPGDQRKLLNQFVSALEEGDEASLVASLARDVEVHSDGGGKVTAARRPIVGRDAVVRFLFGIARARPDDLGVEFAEFNGDPALLLYSGERLFSVMTFLCYDGQIRRIHSVLNPDKLGHLQRTHPSAE